MTKDLFGRPLRVALAGWILDQEGTPFFQREATSAMSAFDEAASGVVKELAIFERHGLLTSVHDGRRIYYTPRSHPLWDAFAAIDAALLSWSETRVTNHQDDSIQSANRAEPPT